MCLFLEVLSSFIKQKCDSLHNPSGPCSMVLFRDVSASSYWLSTFCLPGLIKGAPCLLWFRNCQHNWKTHQIQQEQNSLLRAPAEPYVDSRLLKIALSMTRNQYGLFRITSQVLDNKFWQNLIPSTSAWKLLLESFPYFFTLF